MKKFIPSTKNKITALAFAILPVLVTGLLAYGANIYYDLDAGKIVNGENNELTQNLTVAGSVGIGTTSPAGALHVMGSALPATRFCACGGGASGRMSGESGLRKSILKIAALIKSRRGMKF